MLSKIKKSRVQLIVDHETLRKIREEFYKNKPLLGKEALVFDCQANTKVLSIKVLCND